MPTWLIILLLMPSVLWVLYSFLWGRGFASRATRFVALEALGVWLLWEGWDAQVEIWVVLGATILVSGNIVFLIFYLADRFGANSQRRRVREGASKDAAAAAAVAAGIGLATAAATGGTNATADPNAHTDGAFESGPDLGGFDI
ncbi:MAG: hypothetical protein ACFCUT_09450 [Kiloniellaceae bacterium]